MPLNLITVFWWYYLRCFELIPHQKMRAVIYQTEKLIIVQKMEVFCFQSFLQTFKVLKGSSNTYCSIPGPKGHQGNASSLALVLPALCPVQLSLTGIILQDESFARSRNSSCFYYCSDLCSKVPWPEPLAWKSWFFKVKPDGELIGRKDQFYRTVPSYVYCLNPFYWLWHTVIQVSLQAHFIQISL